VAKPRAIKLQDLNTLGEDSNAILRKIVAHDAPTKEAIEKIVYELLDEYYPKAGREVKVEYAYWPQHLGGKGSGEPLPRSQTVIKISIRVPTFSFGLVATYPVDYKLEQMREELLSRIRR